MIPVTYSSSLVEGLPIFALSYALAHQIRCLALDLAKYGWGLRHSDLCRIATRLQGVRC